MIVFLYFLAKIDKSNGNRLWFLNYFHIKSCEKYRFLLKHFFLIIQPFSTCLHLAGLLKKIESEKNFRGINIIRRFQHGSSKFKSPYLFIYSWIVFLSLNLFIIYLFGWIRLKHFFSNFICTSTATSTTTSSSTPLPIPISLWPSALFHKVIAAKCWGGSELRGVWACRLFVICYSKNYLTMNTFSSKRAFNTQ